MPKFPIGYAGHFGAWMDKWIREEERDATYHKVAALLEREPGLIDEGYSWSRIVEMADN